MCPSPWRGFLGIAFAGDRPGSFHTIIAAVVREKVGRAGAGKLAERGRKELERARKLWQ